MNVRRNVVAVLAAGLVGCLPLAACSDSSATQVDKIETAPLAAGETADHEFVIPLGTGIQIDNGQQISLMPQRLDVKVGESLRIVNNDVRDYMIGVFFVRANQSVAMRFTHAGELRGTCSMNPEGEFVVSVTA